tara:strand:+ start:631 stop:996 length:366 start_codon:yes stop_codon:yes gene_type:complete
MAFPDADYTIVTDGLESEWEARVEEQRQLDLHESTKVNICRAIPRSAEQRHSAQRAANMKYAAKPGMKARKCEYSRVYDSRPENKARAKERLKAKEQYYETEEGKAEVRKKIDRMLGLTDC